MGKIRLKSFPATNYAGEPITIHFDGFELSELLGEIRNQKPGIPIHINRAYLLFMDETFARIEEDGGRAAALWSNQGFVACIQDLGFQIFVRPDDFEAKKWHQGSHLR